MDIESVFSLGELFEKVQMNQVFPDGKTFVDCIPKSSLASIRRRYEEQNRGEGFDLSAFVHNNFDLPGERVIKYVSEAGRSVPQHLEMLWDELTRQPDEAAGSLIPLPHPYIVPGGRFREIYYWDSYFTMLGLQVSNRTDLIQNMVDNFSYLIDHVGYIPNGNRSYYLGRSQPPFYASMVKLLSQVKAESILVKYLPQLEKEYHFWMRGVDELNAEHTSLNRVAFLTGEDILNHYWDEIDTARPESYKEDVAIAQNTKDKKAMYRHLRAAAESGWDFSSRWFRNADDFSSIHTTEIIPVDLNCLLCNLETIISNAFGLSGDAASSLKYETAANNRKAAINKYCWNSESGFYFDFDYIAGKQKESLTLAAVYPLFFKIASKEQAAGVAKVLEERFLSPGGLITTTETTRQQWDAPNGWAPLHWIAVQGLVAYGYHELAKDVATRWMNINEKVYLNTGKMMEKYNVVSTSLEAGGGEYPAQDGFGWTNGVYLALNKWKKEN